MTSSLLFSLLFPWTEPLTVNRSLHRGKEGEEVLFPLTTRYVAAHPSLPSYTFLLPPFLRSCPGFLFFLWCGEQEFEGHGVWRKEDLTLQKDRHFPWEAYVSAI